MAEPTSRTLRNQPYRVETEPTNVESLKSQPRKLVCDVRPKGLESRKLVYDLQPKVPGR